MTPHTASHEAGAPALRWARAASLAAVGTLFCSLSIQKIWAADIWWQLRTGEWILEHGAVPAHDVLSYSAAGHPWIEMRWLFCLFVYLGWKAGGPALLIFAQTAILLAAFSIILFPVAHLAATLSGRLVLILGVLSAASRFVPRPEIITYLCLSLFLVVLHGYARGRFQRAVWTLPVVQVIWTNAHTVFIFGPVLVWLFALGETARGLARRLAAARAGRTVRDEGPGGSGRLLLLAGAVTAACLLNPYGYRGAMFPFLLFREIHKGSLLGHEIAEFRSPFDVGTWSWDIYLAVALVIVAAGSFLMNARRTDPARLAIWAAFLYNACISVRNVAPLALVAIWATLHNHEEIRTARKRRDKRQSRTQRFAPAAHLTLAAILLFASWYVVTDRFFVRMGAPRRFGLGIVEWNTPAGAVDFILKARAMPQVFHSLPDGSYLTWAAKDRFPVYIDGRLEVYGEDFMARYVTLNNQSWKAFADGVAINTAIMERQFFGPLVSTVHSSPGWVLVYMDARDLVFVRDIPEHAELIRRYRIDPLQPWKPRGPEPEELPAGWRRWIGSVEQPWYSYSMAKNFLALGSAVNAERFLTRGLERFPDHAPMRQLLDRIRSRTAPPKG